MPLRIDRLVAFLGIATLFLPGFRIRTDAVDLYLYYGLLPVILILCIASGGRVACRGLVLLLLALSAHSVISVALLDNAFPRAAQQLIGISIISVTFYAIFYVNRFNVAKIFSIYMDFAVVAALIGLCQIIFYLINVKPGYDLGWTVLDYYQSYNTLGIPRIQSVFSEPSHFGLMLSPAIFVSLLNLTGRPTYFIGKVGSAGILLAAALSFSAMAYMAVLFASFLIGLYRGMFRRALIAALAAGLALAAYVLIPDVAVRVDDTVSAFLYSDPIEKNLSTLTLYNNWEVALGNLWQSYLLGGGLGSHPWAFERYSTLFSMDAIPFWLAALNAQDANSLFLRILSELGLPGVLALAGFLVVRHVGLPRPVGAAAASEAALGAWIVSSAALTFIAMALVRHGHYFAFGTPFFLMLYCYAGVHAPATRDAGDVSELEERGPLASPDLA